jgi:dynein heavy chain
MLVGSAGTGKTAVIRNFLAATNPEKVKHTTINFSNYTSSMSL